MRTDYAWLRKQWKRLPVTVQCCLMIVAFVLCVIVPGFLSTAYSTEPALWTSFGLVVLTVFVVLLQKELHWSLRGLAFLVLTVLWLVGGGFVAQQTRDRVEGRLDTYGNTITPEMRAASKWYEELRQQKDAEWSRVVHDVNADTSLPKGVKIDTDSQKIIINDDLMSGKVTGVFDRYNRRSDYTIRKIDGTWRVGCVVAGEWQPVQAIMAAGGRIADHLAATGVCPQL